MARGRSKSNGGGNASGSGATLGFEAKLWQAADALRNNMDAAEYKHVVLGLIFLKYISDAFEAKHARARRAARRRRRPGRPRRVPRRKHLLGAAGSALVASEGAARRSRRSGRSSMTRWRRSSATTRRSRACCRRTTPARASTSSGSASSSTSSATSASAARPTAPRTCSGRVYEYFLSQFASAEGKKGGQFYTPTHVVRVLVEMLAPYKGRVYDPCCGSGGMFVQSEKFIEAHAGRVGDISIYGQESNYTTWRLAKMNLAIRGIDAPDRARRHLPQRPAPRPQGRLRARQPAVQRQRLARRTAEERQALGLRHAAGRQRQLRLGAALHPSSGADRHGRLRARQRLDVVEPVGRGRDPQGDHRGRPRRLHGRAARPALLFDADPGVPVVPRARQEERPLPRPPRRDAVHRRAEARHDGRPRAPRADRRRYRQDRRHLSRLARRQGMPANTPTCRASANRPRSTTSASTATCSPPAAMSAPAPPRRTTSRSTRRCDGSLQRCSSNRPKRQSWTRRLPRA